jgi:hypothetical protein
MQYTWNGLSGLSYFGFEYRVRGFVTQRRVSLILKDIGICWSSGVPPKGRGSLLKR